MMTSSEISKLLNQIEVNYEVEKLNYNGFDLWPSIKILLLKQNITTSNVKQAPSKENKKRYLLKLLLKISSTLKLWMLKFKGADIYFVNFEQHLVKSDGGVLNKFYAQLKIDLNAPYQDFYYFHDSAKLNLNIASNGIKIPASRSSRQRPAIENDAQLFDFSLYLEKNYPYLTDAKTALFDGLSSHLHIVFEAYEIWKCIFEKNKPKVIFTVSYYTPQNLGLIWAAKLADIPVFEIQHGNQINYPPYSFEKIPVSSYNSLPSHFLAWDNSSYKHLNGWTDQSDKINAIHFGNPWSAYLSDMKNTIFQNSRDLFEKSIELSKPIILYTMVPELEIVPQKIAHIIKETQHDYQWLARMHPRQGISMEEVISTLKEKGITEVNVDLATNLPLPILLQYADLHITSWSSTVLEASAFCVKSLLFHEEGKTRYNHLDNVIYPDEIFFFNTNNFREFTDELNTAEKKIVDHTTLNTTIIELLLR